MPEKPQPDDIIPLWFHLCDQMIAEGGQGVNLRPPSLRDACYAYALAHRTADILTSEETVEAFVNGLELGALTHLMTVWEGRYGTRD
jgi:hypothetical protein